MTKLFDAKAPVLPEVARRLRRQETGDPGGYTSVEEGTFRILSDEGLVVEGSERITGEWFMDGKGEVRGTLRIFGSVDDPDAGSLETTGTVLFKGTFTAEGKNTLSGENLLSGPTKVTGTFDVQGNLTSTGVVRLNGDVFVTKTLTITGATKVQATFEASGDTTLSGTLTVSGATTVKSTFRTEGAVTIASTLTISGAANLQSTLNVTGAITAGGVRIEANKVTVSAGGNFSELGSNGVSSYNAAFGNLRITNLADQASLPSAGKWLMAVGSQGVVVAIPQSVGGPMGDLEWPFDPATNTDEYGPRVSPGGIGSTFHRGMDFGIGLGEGTPIPAAGNGTVIERGTNPAAGFGYYLVLQHSNGKRTLYAHMQSASVHQIGDVVRKKQPVGLVGNTGNSTGPHLHLETHVLDGGVYSPVNPREVITKPWSA